MDATSIFSGIGLLFAAVAAWGAWWTVRLTEEIRFEENIRRLLEALLALRDAASALARARAAGGLAIDYHHGPFRDAQLQLERARLLQFSVRGTAADEPTLSQLDFLEAETNDPRKVAATAESVILALRSQPPPKLLPKWWRRLAYRLLRFRSRPANRSRRSPHHFSDNVDPRDAAQRARQRDP